jgi:hypothetical protein
VVRKTGNHLQKTLIVSSGSYFENKPQRRPGIKRRRQPDPCRFGLGIMEASRQSNRDTGPSNIESGGDEMVRANQQAYEYRGNQPRSTPDLVDWHSKAEPSEALEPELPIVDCHHHLFGAPTDKLFYQLEDLHRDLNSGHQVIGTVYVEAYESGWRTTGPVALRPVGEVEMIAAQRRPPTLVPNLTAGSLQVSWDLPILNWAQPW